MGLEPQRQRLLTMLRELAFAEREIVLSSGMRSNFYIDCKTVSLRAEGHVLIGQLFAAALDRLAPAAVAVGGLTLGADPLASATAMQSFLNGSPRDAFIVRKEAKAHGTEKWLEGAAHLPPGAIVAVVEDVVTTGASTLKAVSRVREAGFKVVQVLALVDRLEGGREAVEREVPLFSLFNKKDFLP
jgi:orotate phosphoribosyltransferase